MIYIDLSVFLVDISLDNLNHPVKHCYVQYHSFFFVAHLSSTAFLHQMSQKVMKLNSQQCVHSVDHVFQLMAAQMIQTIPSNSALVMHNWWSSTTSSRLTPSTGAAFLSRWPTSSTHTSSCVRRLDAQWRWSSLLGPVVTLQVCGPFTVVYWRPCDILIAYHSFIMYPLLFTFYLYYFHYYYIYYYYFYYYKRVLKWVEYQAMERKS